MLVPKDSSEGLSGITTSLWHSAQKRRALLCHLSGKNGPLGARIWVVTNRIIKLRAIYSSHNLLSASVFCFLFFHHQLCATCQLLTSASDPPLLPSTGRKPGSDKGRDLFRAPSKLGHAGIQPPRSRSRVLGTLPATSCLCCCSQLLQAGKGISPETFPPRDL